MSRIATHLLPDSAKTNALGHLEIGGCDLITLADKFGTPTFDLFDPRFQDLGVPCNVRGNITFNITDVPNFIKLNRLQEFNLQDFSNQIREFSVRKIKSVVTNLPIDNNIPVMQIERKIDDVSDIVKSKLKQVMEDDFGINLKRLDVSSIELDQEHDHYQQLKKITNRMDWKILNCFGTINLLVHSTK